MLLFEVVRPMEERGSARARSREAGRYVLCEEIGSGGMGTVHLARLDGPAGFTRTVAVKKLHPHLSRDPEFLAMFLNEARLAARIVHPNVVATLDVVQEPDELLVIMDYVHGESLSRLFRIVRERGERVPVPIAVSITLDVLYGLDAAHEAKGPAGEPLQIVHRDVSPHNVMVGRDGVARVLDFGIARASSRATDGGRLMGKLAYMAPEQLTREPVDRRTDVFAASIVLWELLTGERLFASQDDSATAARILTESVEPPSKRRGDLDSALDLVVLRGLAVEPRDRYATAREMAGALEGVAMVARRPEIEAWVVKLAGEALDRRAEAVERTALDSSSARAGVSESAIPTDLLGTGSQTHLSASRPVDRPARRFGASYLVLGASIVAAVAVMATVRVLPWATATSTTANPSAKSDSASAQDRVVAPAPSDAVAAVAPASTALSTASATASSAPARRVVPPPRRPSPKPSKNGCDPPYYFEADGAKHMRPECLR